MERKRRCFAYAESDEKACGYDGPCGAYATIGSCPTCIIHQITGKLGEKALWRRRRSRRCSHMPFRPILRMRSICVPFIKGLPGGIR